MKAYIRLLSILLVIAMCFGLMAVSASAEESAEAPQSAVPVVDGVIIASSDPGEPGAAASSTSGGVAKINVSDQETLYYATVADALAAAQEGQMVILTQDVVLSNSISIPANVSMSLNGKTMTFVPSVSDEAAMSRPSTASGTTWLRRSPKPRPSPAPRPRPAA